MGQLEGKVGLVTGASAGTGAAIARTLHGEGAAVGLLSRGGDDLGLERGLGVACDVRDRAAVAAATDEVLARFGGLDVVVANAGVGAYEPFTSMDPEQVDAMIDVNLKGTLHTACAVRRSARAASPPTSPWAPGTRRTCPSSRA